MITFTPISGAARAATTTPFAFLLQVDDVRILIDCGSPDWNQEPSPFDKDRIDVDQDAEQPPWKEYCDTMEKCVFFSR